MWFECCACVKTSVVCLGCREEGKGLRVCWRKGEAADFECWMPVFGSAVGK